MPVQFFTVHIEQHLVGVRNGKVKVDLRAIVMKTNVAGEGVRPPFEPTTNARNGVTAIETGVQLTVFPVNTTSQADLARGHGGEVALDGRTELARVGRGVFPSLIPGNRVGSDRVGGGKGDGECHEGDEKDKVCHLVRGVV